MKKVLFLTLLLSSAAIAAWLSQGKEPDPCLEDWIAQTQSLFSEAAESLQKLPTTPPPAPTDNLDEKLQALLPGGGVDLSYRPDTGSVQVLARGETSALLPNLFQSSPEKSTSLSGQVHKDEDNNIIGAELQVSIPTHL